MLAAAADAGAADGSAAFASAGEATKQIEAKESVSPSNLFISFSFPKKIRPDTPRRVRDAWRESPA